MARNPQIGKFNTAKNTIGKGFPVTKKDSTSPVIRISLFTSDKVMMDKKMTEIKAIRVVVPNDNEEESIN